MRPKSPASAHCCLSSQPVAPLAQRSVRSSDQSDPHPKWSDCPRAVCTCQGPTANGSHLEYVLKFIPDPIQIIHSVDVEVTSCLLFKPHISIVVAARPLKHQLLPQQGKTPTLRAKRQRSVAGRILGALEAYVARSPQEQGAEASLRCFTSWPSSSRRPRGEWPSAAGHARRSAVLVGRTPIAVRRCSLQRRDQTFIAAQLRAAGVWLEKVGDFRGRAWLLMFLGPMHFNLRN